MNTRSMSSRMPTRRNVFAAAAALITSATAAPVVAHAVAALPLPADTPIQAMGRRWSELRRRIDDLEAALQATRCEPERESIAGVLDELIPVIWRAERELVAEPATCLADLKIQTVVFRSANIPGLDDIDERMVADLIRSILGLGGGGSVADALDIEAGRFA